MFNLTKEEKIKLIEKYKGHSLRDLRPDLAAEWHPTKNGDLTPEMVTAGSQKKVWWYLPYDDPKTGKHFNFEWEAKVANRAVQGYECPYVKGRLVWKGFNDLATTHPEIAVQWHPAKNGDLTPEMVTAGSPKEVWWYLPYDDPKTGKHFNFEWKAKIFDRSHEEGCPYLSGQAIWPGFNDLAAVQPKLALEWHPTKNGDLTPEMVTAGSQKKVWWYLPYDDPKTGKHFNFEWETRILSRSHGKGCPFLSGQAIWPGFNDLASTHPGIAAQWHPTKNKMLTPLFVTAGSAKQIWWRCDKGHVWQASIRNRTYGGAGCSVCNVSHGEARISEFCEKHNVVSHPQYRFSACSYKRTLLFDRAIFHKNGNLAFLVEYDGEQHSRPIDFSGRNNAKKDFELIKIRDKIKNQYCRENKIPLVRIPYWDYDNIEQILLKKMVRYGLLN